MLLRRIQLFSRDGLLDTLYSDTDTTYSLKTLAKSFPALSFVTVEVRENKDDAGDWIIVGTFQVRDWVTGE